MSTRLLARVLAPLLAITGSSAPCIKTTSAELITTLAANGVSVSVRIGTADDCSFANGWYEPESRRVTICQEGVWDGTEAITLAHEAVHAIQHCRGDLSGAEMAYSVNEEQAYEVAKARGFDLIGALQPYYLAGLDDNEMSLEAEAVLRSNTESLTQIQTDFVSSCS